MIDTFRYPIARRYQVIKGGPARRARGVPGLQCLPARRGRPPIASMGWIYHSAPLRMVVLALALVSYSTLARAFTSAGMLQQYLAALVLALVAGSVQMLLEKHAAAHSGMVAATENIALKGRAAPPATLTIPGPNLLPDLATCKAFDDAVRRAFTHLADPTKLSVSPLLHLALISSGLAKHGLADTRLHRASILTGLLQGMVEELRPRHLDGSHTTEAWRFYNCLYYPYVARITRRSAPTVLRDLREKRERDGGPRTEPERVVEWLLQVDEDTYYKWQRRASDTIALSLRERERAASGMPVDHGHVDVA